jgi:hypothetical protein
VSYPVTLTSQAQGDVLRERERQFYEEGWTDEHDDAHAHGELALAGAAYAFADKHGLKPWFWPFDRAWWKPKSRRENLVRAAALIIAEIERIDRRAARAKGAA